MKKQIPIIILSSLLMSSCGLNDNYISFKEYTEIVKEAKQGQRDIFFFTASNCSNCQELSPFIEKYISQNENESLNVYLLSVDYKAKYDGSIVFKDETMGFISGNIENDCIKALDNRLTKMIQTCYPSENDYPNYLFKGIEDKSNYSYVYTPLVIWYESGREVKVANNVLNAIEYDVKGNLVYDSFVEFMQFPVNTIPWNEEFNLNYYSKK